MSIRATPIEPALRRVCSSRSASRATAVPWLSRPVRASRRPASTRARVWRVSRRWVAWKMKYSSRPSDDRGGHDDQGDLAGRVGDGVQDRLGVAVDLEDGRERVVRARDRHVLLEQLAVGREAGGRRVGVVGADDRGRDLAGVEGGLEVVVGSQVLAPQVRPVAVQDGLVGGEDLDVDDARRSGSARSAAARSGLTRASERPSSSGPRPAGPTGTGRSPSTCRPPRRPRSRRPGRSG